MIGPHGEKRPSNPIAHGIHIGKLATGETEEQYIDESRQARGSKGGQARALELTPEQRSESARKAAKSRWHKELPA